ncbi:multidrug DMT transporter permease [Salmonella enterica subsp. houtenae serovar 44:z4,z23:-]|uniref:Multidrug DMT transporter permease n=1 Tax=Salmonella enterica subsp. enterica serovar Gaminara TaxID=913070 RepID=A0A5Z6P872_SALET|nr:DNA circularization N-terminal domain-containing protein [Salmonella enterica]EBY7362884.1 multidrug DMT transporter permease [Salmonella enterica subsp. enterica serovar Tennessee]ECG1246069.1 multidrug DMT transporter permease [Salmonella enterica subsp. houtenae]ECS4567420.1 multidrug DMT transporter permease [Salmonella enterica subsp. enterica serovar Gaminara]EDO4165833.1 multidrug DMT transporter permease [Salmonella enterica subsp. enterica serovar Braenderup]EDT9423859.1 multidrug 
MSPTGKGSFRNIPFLIYKEQRERGGRHIVKREYPLRESGGADDLGPKLPAFTFTVIVQGDDAQAQRKALRDALYAPGAGELVHPDYGTLNVLIDNFESRYNVSEQRVVEFTITAVPLANDTAPDAQQDTAAALTQKTGSGLNSVFNTLADGWSVVSDNLHDLQAMMDTVSEKIDALENTVSSVGILQDISAFAASFTAMKGNITSLITSPLRMAQQFAGVFSGLIALPSVPAMSLLRNHTGTTPSGSLAVPDEALRSQGGTQLYQSLSAFYDTLTTQDTRRSLTGLTPATQSNIRLLQSVMQSAVVLAQAQTAGSLLTIAVAQAGVPAPAPLSGSGTGAGVDASAPVSLLQSAGDVRAVSHALGQSLDAQVLAFSGQGFTRTALALREARLALVEDLTTRGVYLPGTSSVAVRTTQPALVTLYRATGNSVQWQRFVRRNNVIHPLFVPGGQVLEVIDE